jgi:hypothetical protein
VFFYHVESSPLYFSVNYYNFCLSLSNQNKIAEQALQPGDALKGPGPIPGGGAARETRTGHLKKSKN